MKLANINRDYMVIIDVKSGSVNKPTMVFYNTDKNTSNIYVQLVVKETIVAATPIENATDYSVELKVVKPGNIVKFMDGVLVNEAEAIYEFNLPEDFTNLSGNYDIEFWVKAKVNDRDEMITSSKAKYTVKPSILTDLDEAIEDHEDYPLFLKLMEEVKVINETAHELDTTIRTLQADMIHANNEMKANEEQRKANEVLRETNEANRVAQENARQEYLNAFDGKWEEYKANTDADIADYKAQINAQEVAREQAEATREANEQRRIGNEDERKVAENQRKANEFERRTNEAERKSAEASRVSAENARVANEEQRQANEANREVAEQIRKTNEQARIAEHETFRTEHEQMRTELNEVKAENAILMENDKKIADRMTQVEISDKRQYVIMEGLMNSAGDGYLKIEDTGNDTTLYNSVEGFVDVKNITGNTMVNSIKNPDDELTLNADINTSGQSVTLTTAVDNGQVDVLAEGNTMVNVCDQQEAVAITKNYTVETGNHVTLQGEYDGKARPVPTGNTLVNLIDITKITNAGGIYFDGSVITMKEFEGTWSSCVFTDTVSLLKPSTKYTMIINIIENTTGTGIFVNNVDESGSCFENFAWGYVGDLGLTTKVLTTKSDLTGKQYSIRTNGEKIEGKYVKLQIMLLEGDYTNKPIPDYFTGMKSSFEDKVVTQEMVDSGAELAENLGKYRVDYKVTGKNKIPYVELGDINADGRLTPATDISRTGYIPIKANTSYKWSENSITDSNWYKVFYYDKNKKFIKMNYTREPLLDKDGYIIVVKRNPNAEEWTPQLEEGSTATAYEPYKEHIKTYYLNSPLLEGDTIEDNGNDVVHVHRYKKETFDGSSDEAWVLSTASTDNSTRFKISTPGLPNKNGVIPMYCDILPVMTTLNTDVDGIQLWGDANECQIRLVNSKLSSVDVAGFKQWLQSNPITIIYELASPQYELISQSDTILTDSYVAGHLDFDTAVPVEKVEFRRVYLNLKYLYSNTKYNIQFEADNNGTASFALGNNGLPNQSIIKGLNKFEITTSNEDKLFHISGIGFNASNIVVTEATDKDFGYFSGMKSVGELEENKIEILSRNKNLFDGISVIDGFNNENGLLSAINTESDTRIWHYDNSQYFTNLKAGTYSITLITVNPSTNNASGIRVCDSNNVSVISGFSTTQLKTTGTYNRTFTINQDEKIGIMIKMFDGTYKIQIEKRDTATDYIPHAENKKQILLNEPLRAVGDTKDRFVQIDGKWYVERNVGEVVLDGSENWSNSSALNGTEVLFFYYINSLASKKSELNCLSDKFKCYSTLSRYANKNNNIEAMYVGDNTDSLVQIHINKSKLIGVNVSDFKSYLQSNPIRLIFELASPTYEPVEISPVLNTYSDVTHITNNSTIPMNMNIKNSGYEIIAKPNTKYTVVGMTNGRIGDSTIVNGTITTPATITDNFLRPYGTGKTSKVMLLEGEPANIPGYFKGIKSVFEDKVTEDGKYAVEVKIVGKNKATIEIPNGYRRHSNGTIAQNTSVDGFIAQIIPNTRYTFSYIGDNNFLVSNIAFFDNNMNYISGIASQANGSNVLTPINAKFITLAVTKDAINFQLEEGTVASEYEPYHETKQTLYLDEPLYNTNNITIYNDKLGYWKNWNKVVLDGSEDEDWACETPMAHTIYGIKTVSGMTGNKLYSNEVTSYDSSIYSKDIEGMYTTNDGRLKLKLSLAKLSTQNIVGFRQYLSQNPITVVYQLAEPVFVPLIDNCPNFVIGSWDNCSIHFDSIIPLKDTRYRYTGNVPSVMTMSDDVAETKSISDEQDALLVDMATELAVMKLTM